VTATVLDVDLRDLGEFDVVLADPPWRSDFGKTCSRAVERHYPTMLLPEIKALPVPAAASSMLFLWTTNPMLVQALEVMATWGWTYRTNIAWVKPKAGTGKYVRGQHELLLIGRRGKMPAPKPGTLPPSIVRAAQRGHSVKPDEVYAMIEKMYPDTRRLELFARRPWPGWTSWGRADA
jgi:N6-adenosine-specific RNA methylase IME4